MTQSRVALVTGAAGGLGSAIAARLAADGCTVLAADVNSVAFAPVSGVTPMVLDVADEASVTDAVAAITRTHGRLDIVVNNAGVSGERGPLETMSLAAFERTIRINLTGTFLVSRAAIAPMRARGWGRIVNMASLVARGQPGVNRANYTASKAGIVGFSRVLAAELARDAITVNCVAPSRIETPLTRATGAGKPDFFTAFARETPLGRLGQPEDVAGTVAWLCSDAATGITGAVVDINGGIRMS